MQNCPVMYLAVRCHQFLAAVVSVALPWRNPAVFLLQVSDHGYVAGISETMN